MSKKLFLFVAILAGIMSIHMSFAQDIGSQQEDQYQQKLDAMPSYRLIGEFARDLTRSICLQGNDKNSNAQCEKNKEQLSEVSLIGKRHLSNLKLPSLMHSTDKDKNTLDVNFPATDENGEPARYAGAPL